MCSRWHVQPMACAADGMCSRWHGTGRSKLHLGEGHGTGRSKLHLGEGHGTGRSKLHLGEATEGVREMREMEEAHMR